MVELVKERKGHDDATVTLLEFGWLKTGGESRAGDDGNNVSDD